MEYVPQLVEGKRPPAQVATGDTTSLLASHSAHIVGGYMVPASWPFLAYVILPTWPGPLPLLSWGVRTKVHP